MLVQVEIFGETTDLRLRFPFEEWSRVRARMNLRHRIHTVWETPEGVAVVVKFVRPPIVRGKLMTEYSVATSSRGGEYKEWIRPSERERQKISKWAYGF